MSNTLSATSLTTTNNIDCGGNLSIGSNANIVSGDYRIGNSTVLSNSTLGSGIINSSLTTVGTLENLTVSGDLNIDSNTLKVDSTTNKVGIVTNTPVYPLDVTGDVNVPSGSTYKIAGTNVLSSTALGSGITNSSLTSIGTLGSLTVTGNLAVDSSTLTVDSTNNRIGIVNASPAYVLDVSGDCNIASGSTYKIAGRHFSIHG